MKANRRHFAAAKEGDALELFVYDSIGEDWNGQGISAKTVQEAIKTAGRCSRITAHINSPGGDSFEGVTIYNILRQQGVPINVIVEGLAASAAFTIAMGGDKIEICDGAMMMLHNAWSISIGDASEMRKTADLLDKVSTTMGDIYTKRSGLSSRVVKDMMDAETWLGPEDAVSKGFATEHLSTTPQQKNRAAEITSQYNLSKFCRQAPAARKAKDHEFAQWSEDLERRARLRVALLAH